MQEERPLFYHGQSMLLRAALQGHMGKIDHFGPWSLATIGDFQAIAGKTADAPQIKSFIKWLDYDTIVLMEKGWIPYVQKYHDGHLLTRQRHAFSSAPVKKLAMPALPKGFTLCPVDAQLAAQAIEGGWADLGANFRSLEDFLQRGFGYAAVFAGEGICFASSYTVCDEGISIQIDTREDFRRRGLARACATAIINTCQERGLYPEWDADNAASLQLAHTLGYTNSFAYNVYTLVKG